MEIKETFVKRVERELRDLYCLWKRNRGIFFIVLIIGAGYFSYAFRQELIKVFEGLNKETQETKTENVRDPTSNLKPNKPVSLRLPLVEISNELSIEISNICKRNCGNKGDVTFNQIDITTDVDGNLKFNLLFKLYEHQEQKVFGVPLYSVGITSHVKLNGYLDISSCKLDVRTVSISKNGRAFFTKAQVLIDELIFKEYDLTNCNNLIQKMSS